MRRLLLLAAAFAALTAFEFQVFPGHTYLRGATQLYVPMLQRLATPGYLSRDLVATHPDFTYTIYDEVTILLSSAPGLDFEKALGIQQLLFRLAGLIGLFLISKAAWFHDFPALILSAVVNFGSRLAGPQVRLFDPEPTAEAFAFSLAIFATGCLVRGRSLLAGLAGGLALLYDALIAAPFWIVVIASLIFHRSARSLLRPTLTLLVVFILLLANLAQLQPGISESVPFFSTTPGDVWSVLRFRTPFVWPSLWPRGQIYLFVGIWTLSVWAIARDGDRRYRRVRWFLTGLSLLGTVSIPATVTFLARFRWALIADVQPARMVMFTVCISALACGITAIRSFQMKRWREGVAWAVAVCAIQILPGVAYAQQSMQNRWRPVADAVQQLAAWGEANTWGSSLFAFPDAGHADYPSIFRARSRRGLWVDWQSGIIAGTSDSAARAWWERWNSLMQGPFSVPRVQRELTLPVDYWVLKRSHMLECSHNGTWVAPSWAFLNSDFVVYDAITLRNSSCTLEIARIHLGD